jgi:hypothetical protein
MAGLAEPGAESLGWTMVTLTPNGAASSAKLSVSSSSAYLLAQ